eukprot:scaffold3305_cov211-Prasinococcus_capsulatus_cf.AAC.1
MNFVQLYSDPCVYKRLNAKGEIDMILAVYVDDILMVSASRQSMEDQWKNLQSRFDLKYTMELGMFLGMEIEYSASARQVRLRQERFVLELLTRFRLTEAKTIVDTPVPVGWVQQPNSRVLTGSELTECQSMVGSMMWLAKSTRPDL